MDFGDRRSGSARPRGQLWAGPKPTGGYGTVQSGSTFQFGKALPIREYFPEARDYKIYWKAAAFRSNVAWLEEEPLPSLQNGEKSLPQTGCSATSRFMTGVVPNRMEQYAASRF